jgi:tetraprenyl-beta-curcumene synthase
LLWGLGAVSHEVEHWKIRARCIPDPAIRTDALDSLTHKRPNADGAALLWTIPNHRQPRLLRLLVAYETMADFLDSANERGAAAGTANGRQLQIALAEAVDPALPVSEHYSHHPWHEDGGYLHALVHASREGCATLPSYESVHKSLTRASTLAQVQGLRHALDPAHRNTELQKWAAQLPFNDRSLDWFELAGAASAWLSVLALLALGAQPACSEHHAAKVCAAYFPWVALTATMMDSYADMHEDAAAGTDSYVAYYPTPHLAIRRAQELARRAACETQALPDGPRHAVILASMIAMYLSKDSARTPELRATSRSIARAGGPLTLLLLPALRAWRIANSQRAT